MASGMRSGLFCVLAVALLMAGCASDSAVSLPCPEGQVFEDFDSDVCVVDDAGEAGVVTQSSTSAAVVASTVQAEATSSSTMQPDAAVDATTIVEEDLVELTWASEGTVEADIERAFWKARPSRRAVYTENVLDPNYEPLVDTHTGRDLERISDAVAELAAKGGEFYRYPEPSEAVVEFVTVVGEGEALMQICELDRGEYYVDGELKDDRDFDAQFQARFVLVDTRWLWEETIKLKFEPLLGDQPTCMSDSGT